VKPIRFAALLALAPLVAAASFADPTPVSYRIDLAPWKKDATPSTSLGFELFSDAACTASVHSEMVLASDLAVEQPKGVKLKGGAKLPKVGVMHGTLDATATGQLWLEVTGTGVTPLGGACQAQAGSGRAVAAAMTCPAGEAVVGFDAAGAPLCANVVPYDPAGPQTNVDPSELVGWTQCHSGTYDDGSASLATILAACTGSRLLLACRPVGATPFSVLAAAPRADVLTDTGTGNTPHNANGTGWYFDEGFSWGFAAQGDPIQRTSCDTDNTNAEKKLCWHTFAGNLDGGWRCGTATGAYDTFERVIYQR
jgi:hypothetical protein